MPVSTLTLSAALLAFAPPAVVPAAPGATPPVATTPAAAVSEAPAPTVEPQPPTLPESGEGPAVPAGAPVPEGPQPDTLAPPMEPAPVLAPTIAPASETRVVRITPRPVEKTGRGMLIAGSIVGGLGLISKLAATVRIGRGIQGSGFISFDVWTAVGVSSLSYNPFIGTSLGLLGGGFWRRGRWAADQDVLRGATEARRPRRAALGWGLFGGGLGLWAATRLLGAFACQSDACSFAVLETGYYAALGMTGTGVALGAWSTGYTNYARRFETVARTVRVAPMAGRGDLGLSVSGRF